MSFEAGTGMKWSCCCCRRRHHHILMWAIVLQPTGHGQLSKWWWLTLCRAPTTLGTADAPAPDSGDTSVL
jgi:hypothetical protein